MSDQGFNIGNVRSSDPDDEHSLIEFSVEVPDLFALSPLLSRVKRLPGVIDAQHVEKE
jgi:(p)ppGpp synthase/HD superfamily hydrolase